MSDAAVQAKTGKTWREWFAVLDHAGARTMSHKDIAAYLLGAVKSHVVVQHGKLVNATQAAKVKAYWKAALERLAVAL